MTSPSSTSQVDKGSPQKDRSDHDYHPLLAWILAHPILFIGLSLYTISVLTSLRKVVFNTSQRRAGTEPRPGDEVVDCELDAAEDAAEDDRGQTKRVTVNFHIRRTDVEDGPGEENAKATTHKNAMKTEDPSCVVVFEGQPGFPLACWGYMQAKLGDFLPTLSYNRLGYGLSSDALSSARDSITLAKELFSLLCALGLVHRDGPKKSSVPPPPPIVLVGHSFGGLTVLALEALYHPKNLLGIILLDTPPPSLLRHHKPLADFLQTRLPRVLNTAASMASMNLLRPIQILTGLAIIQPTPIMRTRIYPRYEEDLEDVRRCAWDERLLRAVKWEVEGVGACLAELSASAPSRSGVVEVAIGEFERLMRDECGWVSSHSSGDGEKGDGDDEWTRVSELSEEDAESERLGDGPSTVRKSPGGGSKGKGKKDKRQLAVVVITLDKVERPMVDLGIPYEKWKETWNGYQRRMVDSLNQNEAIRDTDRGFLVDEMSDNASLCVSDKLFEAISIVLAAHNIKIALKESIRNEVHERETKSGQ